MMYNILLPLIGKPVNIVHFAPHFSETLVSILLYA